VRIVQFAAQRRLPAMSAYRELVAAGGLISFGPSYAGMHRRAAFYVDRILKAVGEVQLVVPGCA
jgi:putative ABC transport system substrate-binding protein